MTTTIQKQVEDYYAQKGFSGVQVQIQARDTMRQVEAIKSGNVPKFISLGRVNDLLAYPEADRIAICTGPGAFSDYKVKVYPSRKALESFLKNPGHWCALVKNTVDRNMMIYPAFEKTA